MHNQFVLLICLLIGSPAWTQNSQQRDWEIHGLNHAETRHSQLTNINRQNINELGLAWYFEIVLNYPFHVRSLGMHFVCALNLLSSFLAHASANALACALDGGSPDGRDRRAATATTETYSAELPQHHTASAETLGTVGDLPPPLAKVAGDGGAPAPLSTPVDADLD